MYQIFTTWLIYHSFVWSYTLCCNLANSGKWRKSLPISVSCWILQIQEAQIADVRISKWKSKNKKKFHTKSEHATKQWSGHDHRVSSRLIMRRDTVMWKWCVNVISHAKTYYSVHFQDSSRTTMDEMCICHLSPNDTESYMLVTFPCNHPWPYSLSAMHFVCFDPPPLSLF